MTIQRWIERTATRYPVKPYTMAKMRLTAEERYRLVDDFIRRNRNRGRWERAYSDPQVVHRTILALEAEGFYRPSFEEIFRKLPEVAWR